MKLKEFRAKVEEFMSLNCEDYFQGHAYEIDDDTENGEPLRAAVTLRLDDDCIYTVPLVDDDGTLAVEAEEGCCLDADGKGMFSYLFFEVADGRQKTVAEQGD